MKNQPQLIAYVDRLPGRTFRDLRRLLDGPLAGVFGGVHVLPFFHPIDGADAGFDPIDHTQVVADARRNRHAGMKWAVYLLPLSGLFTSVVYPTLNSKGISCLPKSEHGAAAGVILFFTCVSAVLMPLAIGAVSDAFGHVVYGFWLAIGLAALLFIGLILNWTFNPTRAMLEQLDVTEYRLKTS